VRAQYTDSMTEIPPAPEPVRVDASVQDQLDDIYDLVRANNKLLKRIRRDALVGTVVKTLIWTVLIIGTTYYSFKFIEPYLGMLGGSDTGGMDWKALLDEYKGQ
jgi:hypothetical protein